MSINLAKAIVLIAGTWLLTSQCEQVIMAVAGDNNLSSEIKRSVGRRCVAIGCGNTNKDGVSLFGFPKDKHYRKLWTDEVKKWRQDFTEPTNSSALCSNHFSPDMMDQSCLLSEQFNIAKRKRLLSTAVPTIDRPSSKKSKVQPVRNAAVKRRRKQASKVGVLSCYMNER